MKRFADIMREFTPSNDFSRRLNEASALQAWERVVSTQIAENTSPKYVRNGILYVRAKSPAWAQELSTFVPRLRHEINRLTAPHKIRDIKFFCEAFEKEVGSGGAGKPDLDDVRLDEMSVRAVSETASLVRDDDLREKLASLMTRSKKLNHWRRETGWSACPHCGRMVAAGEKQCKFCVSK